MRISFLLGLNRHRFIFALLYVFYILLIIFGVGIIVTIAEQTSSFMGWLYLLMSGFVGFLLYVFAFLFFHDMIKIISYRYNLSFLKYHLSHRRGGIAVLFMASLVSIYGIWNAYQFHITEQIIEIAGLEKPLRIAVMSDMHLGGHRDGSIYGARCASHQ